VLIERGAAVNQGDNSGFTPLHLAAANGYLEIARLLLEAGADANARTSETAGTRWGNKTPLELLADTDRKRDDGSVVLQQADSEMAALLRQHRATS
jgi:ankyrin repeat protein